MIVKVNASGMMWRGIRHWTRPALDAGRGRKSGRFRLRDINWIVGSDAGTKDGLQVLRKHLGARTIAEIARKRTPVSERATAKLPFFYARNLDSTPHSGVPAPTSCKDFRYTVASLYDQ